ncbi:MAG: KpsF/GutQ family sugar-phosphate isomerase [Gammaproteobacteria bacterium]|nr:KpsF/GutQ family sugar-phosphate isomerase [Gammaproteobacteria bacterium]
MVELDTKQAIELARAVIKEEANAVLEISERIDNQFISACNHLLNPAGRIVVLGIGKSGHIGRKIAATLASTGSPAFFVSAAEASHGDLGMIDKHDVAILLSNSGQSEELLSLLPPLKRLGIPLITLTGNKQSQLAKNANVNLDVSVKHEACPLGLAPTTSTIAMLAMGDALAIALLDARGFNEQDFARSHPAGRLGKRLLIKVADIMHHGEEIPIVHADMSLKQGLLEMTSKGLGMTAITDQNNLLIGIFTDGDLRRVLDTNMDVNSTLMKDVMTANCHTASDDQLAAEILDTMQKLRINSIPVVNSNNELIGALNMHDLLSAGVI